MKKVLLLTLLVAIIFPVSASVGCHKNIEACVLYVEEPGYVMDRTTNKAVAEIGNLGAFSDVAIYKYGEQYALVQENRSNDRLVTVVPLEIKIIRGVSDLRIIFLFHLQRLLPS